MTTALFIWAFLQCLIMGFAIGFVKKSPSNSILSGVFFTMSLNLLFQYLFRYTDVKYDIPELLFLSDVLDLLQPGLILWYLDVLFGNKLTKSKLWYFLPAGLCLVAGSIFNLSIDEFTYDSFIGTPFHHTILGSIVFWRAFVFIKIIKSLKDIHSKVDAKKVNDLLWPKILAGFVGLTFYIALLQFSYRIFVFPNYNSNLIWNIIQVNYILFNSSIVFVTIYFALKFPKALSGNTITVKIDSGNQTIMNHYTAKLEKLIEEEKIHIDTELNEKMLAQKLGIPSYMLSRLMNEHLGKSFSEYFNEMRVNEAKELIKKDMDKKLTNFAIAVDCGFRSESVFYINFKKITGMTPRQFRIKAKSELEMSHGMTG